MSKLKRNLLPYNIFIVMTISMFYEMQTFLGRQGKYLEAQKVKASADRKEMKQLQSTIASYQAEIVLKEQAVKAKQQTEMTNLLQRAAQTRDELRRNKGRDVACCTQASSLSLCFLFQKKHQSVFSFLDI